MSIRLCGHPKPDGVPCGSPALRGQRLCYFHQRHLQERLALAQDRRRVEICDWRLPPLDSPQVIQRALYRIMNEVWTGRLDSDRAGSMLYTLQQAAARLRSGPKPPRTVPVSP